MSILDSSGIKTIDLSKVRYSKTKFDILTQTVKTNFTEKFMKAFRIEPKNYSSGRSQNVHNDKFKEALCNLQKEFMQLSTNIKKLEILALLPKSWTFSKISEYFPITYYIYRKLNQLERSLGKKLKNKFFK